MGVIVSFYYFPFEFIAIPGVNTKVMLALAGIPLMGYHIAKLREPVFSKELLIATLLAGIFSLVCYFSIDYNNSEDYAYVTYILSMWVWFSASYVVCFLISILHKSLSFRLITDYLLSVCVVQCILALLINFIPELKIFVDTHITMGITDFLNEVDRLYGVGATLDVAGVRFSAVLIMLSVLLIKSRTMNLSKLLICSYIIGFFIIAVIGNMISRTTLIGLSIGLLYMFLFSGLVRLHIRLSSLRIWKLVLAVGVPLILLCIYLYNTNKEANVLLRFGFEGFFNWVETGVWRTDSTDRLNSVMWIWPEANNYKTWLIGDAVFSNWEDVGTDIGYCRFIFYAGLSGLVAFSCYFIYVAYGLIERFPEAKHILSLLLILLFVNWFKVSTDIFLVFALFLSMGSPYLYKKYRKEDLI